MSIDIEKLSNEELVSNYIKLSKWTIENEKDIEKFKNGLDRLIEYEIELNKRGIDPDSINKELVKRNINIHNPH